MSTSALKEKLHEKECKAKRSQIIERIDLPFKSILESAVYSVEAKASYFAAYPTAKGGKTVPSRGNVFGWVNFEISDLGKIKNTISHLEVQSDVMGWLSFESEVPNFYVSGRDVIRNFDIISKYLIDVGDFDVKWTGEDKDCGFIIEQYNQRGNFEFSSWGF